MLCWEEIIYSLTVSRDQFDYIYLLMEITENDFSFIDFVAAQNFPLSLTSLCLKSKAVFNQQRKIIGTWKL